MRCAWQAYIGLLPVWMRQGVDKQGRESLQELRLRLNMPPELITSEGSVWLEKKVTEEDIRFCINMATRYSPWAAGTAAQGYITAAGGHRIGLCGEAVISDGIMTGIKNPTALCLRVARDFPGIAQKFANVSGSVLIIGKPGSGKTTFLRDLIRQKSDSGSGSIAVVDERCEIFPYFQNAYCFPTGKKTDILSGCPKTTGIEMLLRSMGPEVIAVDEITADEDCRALIHAGWCGVKLIATAHAGNRNDLFSRSVYRPILDSRLFDTLIILRPDKSWQSERMTYER